MTLGFMPRQQAVQQYSPNVMVTHEGFSHSPMDYPPYIPAVAASFTFSGPQPSGYPPVSVSADSVQYESQGKLSHVSQQCS